MSFLGALRRLSIVGAGAAAGLALAWRDDLKQLQFEAVSATGPLVRLLDAETAHNVGIWATKHGLLPVETRAEPASLATTVWGRDFKNPIGVAAGFDKDAEAFEGLLGLGFGFVEIGSVTPLPQPGNPQPRAFRLSEQRAVINRYGFNSAGVDDVAGRLSAYRKALLQEPWRERGLLGVNLGKNKLSEDSAADYAIGVTKLAPYADYLVVNVSSPNTPGLRALQDRKALERLVRRVKSARDALPWGPLGAPPLLIKIAPDLTESDKSDIAAVALRTGVDGLVISNTTITRPPAVESSPHAQEAGGLSGAPLFELSTAVLSDMYRLTKGKIPIIGCGGVSNGYDAYAKIRAGASLVEVYTAFAYEGPRLVPAMKRQLQECLERDGFSSVKEAVGADHRK